MTDDLNESSGAWKRLIWLSLLVASSVAFSLSFACAVPLAAFAAVAALTLPRRDAFLLGGAVWLANQVVGFAFLHYPRTPDTFVWGAAMGVTTSLATLAALVAARRLDVAPAVVRSAVAFLAAFAAYEATLIAFSLVLGGIELYTPAIQGRIFAINGAALVGLLALDRLGVAVGLARPIGSKPALSALDA